MYADFSCEFDGFDEFIYLTPQAKSGLVGLEAQLIKNKCSI